jgi:hypothetical protein
LDGNPKVGWSEIGVGFFFFLLNQSLNAI